MLKRIHRYFQYWYPLFCQPLDVIDDEHVDETFPLLALAMTSGVESPFRTTTETCRSVTLAQRDFDQCLPTARSTLACPECHRPSTGLVRPLSADA